MTRLMQAVSSTVRGTLVAAPGKKLVAADLANIEGRFLAWLAGEEWKLQAFRDFDTILGYDDHGEPIRKGEDLYKLTAGGILGKPASEVTKQERQEQGKVPELACGYGGAKGAFNAMAHAFGMDLPEAQVMSIVRGWRKTNPKIVQLWYDLEEMVARAIKTPGKRFECGYLAAQRDGAWLRIRLPSGRVLCYPSPQLDDEGITYMGVNQYSRRWERIRTYGGKVAENCTQAGARDILAHNMPAIEEAGYHIVITCHDENVTETPDTDDYTAEELCRLMTTNPPWADGLPLAAEGWEAARYRK